MPWDGQTDTFITNIDKTISKQYGISLRDFLQDPDKFSDTKDILAKVENIRAAVDEYFAGLRSSLTDESAAFTKALEEADAQYAKMDEAIATKASLSRVPYIKPFDVDFSPDAKEEITIDKFNNAADALVTKLIGVSSYVGDLSYSYDKYTIGSWIFSGQKVYVVSCYLPDSIIMEIDGLNGKVDELINSAYQQLRLSLGK